MRPDVGFSFDDFSSEVPAPETPDQHFAEKTPGNIQGWSPVELVAQFHGFSTIPNERGDASLVMTVASDLLKSQLLALCGFRFAPSLPFDLPVREQILVAAPWTLPGTLHGICSTFMEHFNNQMAMQAHRWMAVDPLWLERYYRLKSRSCFQGHLCGSDFYRRSGYRSRFCFRLHRDFDCRLGWRLKSCFYSKFRGCSPPEPRDIPRRSHRLARTNCSGFPGFLSLHFLQRHKFPLIPGIIF